MYGFQNESFIYAVIDLIRAEISKTKIYDSVAKDSPYQESTDPFTGIPNVTLLRELESDPEQLTSVTLTYPSNYVMDIRLILGSQDTSTFPSSVNLFTPEADYYYEKRLNNLIITTTNDQEEPIVNYNISLNYNSEGQLIGTTVTTI